MLSRVEQFIIYSYFLLVVPLIQISINVKPCFMEIAHTWIRENKILVKDGRETQI